MNVEVSFDSKIQVINPYLLKENKFYLSFLSVL